MRFSTCLLVFICCLLPAMLPGGTAEEESFAAFIADIRYWNEIDPTRVARLAGHAGEYLQGSGTRGQQVLLHTALALSDALRHGYKEERVRLNRLLGPAKLSGEPAGYVPLVRLALADLTYRHGDLRYAMRQLRAVFNFLRSEEYPELHRRTIEMTARMLIEGPFPEEGLRLLNLHEEEDSSASIRWDLLRAEAYRKLDARDEQVAKLERAGSRFSPDTHPRDLGNFWVQRIWLALEDSQTGEAKRYLEELHALVESSGSPYLEGEAAMIKAVLLAIHEADPSSIREALLEAREAFRRAVFPARYPFLLETGLEVLEGKRLPVETQCFLEELAGFIHQEENIRARIEGFTARATLQAGDSTGPASRVLESMELSRRYERHYLSQFHQLKEEWKASERASLAPPHDNEPLLELFYLVLILLVLLGIVLVLWNRVRVQRHLNRELEDSVARARVAEQAAEESNRLKSRFLANISHEMKTPMGGIVGMASLLDEVVADPSHRKYLATIRACSENLLVLMNDLLDLGRMESGAVEIEPHPMNLRETVRFSVEMIRKQAEDKGIGLKTDFPEDLPVTVIADATRVGQILTNLLTNALKFTREGEIRVEVGFRQTLGSSANLELLVHDTGIGIPPEKQKMIFEPFHRDSDQLEPNPGGNGLGLAICRKLVQLMGGTISVQSNPGEGSTFKVVLPVRI